MLFKVSQCTGHLSLSISCSSQDWSGEQQAHCCGVQLPGRSGVR